MRMRRKRPCLGKFRNFRKDTVNREIFARQFGVGCRRMMSLLWIIRDSRREILSFHGKFASMERHIEHLQCIGETGGCWREL